MPTILVVDHDLQELGMIKSLLVREGYDVLQAHSTAEALSILDNDGADLCLVNMLLSGTDGLSLCRKIRRNPDLASMPVIFLTGPDSPYTVADALNAGGDDYLRKPFIMKELAARIRAHLRRSMMVSNDEMPLVEVNPNALTVTVNGRRVELTRVEFDLFIFLCNTPQQLHSTESLLTQVWQYPRGTGDSALVRNHIRNLRRKLEDDPDHPVIIQSRHGRGYTIKAQIQIQDQIAGRVL
ncbi:MAG: response regulator transcription factor [Anaerolineae bacterium]|nr:response regulator transcription factor [Anaerolineae bacterium]